MRAILRLLGPFPTRFWPRFGLFDYRKAGGGRPDSAFRPAGRFPTWFGTPSGCANLRQNAGHHAAHLSRRGRALFAFPRTQQRQAEGLAEQQLIAGTRYDPTPALHLLRGAQVRGRPEQILFEEAVAMLLGEALAIPTRCATSGTS